MAEIEGQLSQHILGLEPYVLIRLTGIDPGDPEAFRVSFEYGGGLDKESAFELLKAITEDSEEA